MTPGFYFQHVKYDTMDFIRTRVHNTLGIVMRRDWDECLVRRPLTRSTFCWRIEKFKRKWSTWWHWHLFTLHVITVHFCAFPTIKWTSGKRMRCVIFVSILSRVSPRERGAHYSNTVSVLMDGLYSLIRDANKLKGGLQRKSQIYVELVPQFP